MTDEAVLQQPPLSNNNVMSTIMLGPPKLTWSSSTHFSPHDQQPLIPPSTTSIPPPAPLPPIPVQQQQHQQQPITPPTSRYHHRHCLRWIRTHLPASWCKSWKLQDDANKRPNLVLPNLGSGPDPSRVDNMVITAKYRWYTFIPRSLLEQFRHLTNVYFVIIFLIAVIGTSSLKWFDSPLPSEGFALALAVVLGFTMAFEGFYDWRRSQEDTKVNGRMVRRLVPTPPPPLPQQQQSATATAAANDEANNEQHDTMVAITATVEEVAWHTLLPGDVVIVDRDTMFPADLLFLVALPDPSAAASNGGGEVIDHSRCYVETSNIDGETNLKIRASPIPSSMVPSSSPTIGGGSVTTCTNWFTTLSGWRLEYEPPSSSLEFSGTLSNLAITSKQIPVETSHLLLRGSVLKNTHQIVGLVTYAGIECKSVQSTSATRTKTSNVIILVNKIIILILFLGSLMVIISAAVAANYVQLSTELWYLKGGADDFLFGPFFGSFFTFVILYAAIVPIALILAITIMNFCQMWFVNRDLNMYDEEKDRAARCATMELCQEIGQVSYLFSDKTGTLTRNEMKLVGLSVCGLTRTFGVLDVDETDDATTSGTVSAKDSIPIIFARALANLPTNEKMQELLCIMAVCHTVVVDGHGANIRYNAEGPDEEALVNATAMLGYRLTSTAGSIMKVETSCLPGSHAPTSATPPSPSSQTYKYEIIGVNRFDSTRKRMSVIVRLPNGRIQLMCKGADSVMKNLMKKDDISAQEEQDRSVLGHHLDTFAENGLRTLVFATKFLSEKEYERWSSEYHDAYALVGKDRLVALSKAADTIETRLSLVGATAIEDRLQDGVPETLAKLREAGVRTWVLTGDKLETAVNIGFSAGVLTTEMEIVELVSENRGKCVNTLVSLSKIVDPGYVPPPSIADGRTTARPHHSHHSHHHSHRNIELKADASGEDPYGMQGFVTGVMGNGFHKVSKVSKAATAAATNAMRRVKSDVVLAPWAGTPLHKSSTTTSDRFQATAAPQQQPPQPQQPQKTILKPSSTRDLLPMSESARGPRTSPPPPPRPMTASSIENKNTMPAHVDRIRAASMDENVMSASLGTLFHMPPSATSTPSLPPSFRETHSSSPSTGADVVVPFPLNNLPPPHTITMVEEGSSEEDLENPQVPQLPQPPPPPLESTLIRQHSTSSYNVDRVASNLALVVTGGALDTLLSDMNDDNHAVTDTEHLFLSVAKVCNVVLACRVSPRQKALLVRLVRRGVTIGGKEPITMAVGDGANDVAMIQESRVGVGIAGREGSQAVNAADFSIGQFRFLQDLLLVHGRWNYLRMSLVVLYVFYSNLILIFCAFLYNTVTFWSGTSPYFVVWITMFSYVIVNPCILAAVFNQDVSRTTALRYPSLYVSGRANLMLGRFKMLEYIWKSITHSLIVGMLMFYVLTPPTMSYSAVGTETFFCIMAVSQSRLVIEVQSWTWPTVLFLGFAFGIFLWLEPFVYATDPSIYTLWGDTILFGSYTGAWCWTVVTLIVGIVVAVDLFFSAIRKEYFPTIVDVVTEIDRGYPESRKEEHSKRAMDLDNILKNIAVPVTMSKEAIKLAVKNAKNITLVPKFRSSYAHDVTDRIPNLEMTAGGGGGGGGSSRNRISKSFRNRLSSIGSVFSPRSVAGAGAAGTNDEPTSPASSKGGGRIFHFGESHGHHGSSRMAAALSASLKGLGGGSKKGGKSKSVATPLDTSGIDDSLLLPHDDSVQQPNSFQNVHGGDDDGLVTNGDASLMPPPGNSPQHSGG